jgi:hypothetical protein
MQLAPFAGRKAAVMNWPYPDACEGQHRVVKREKHAADLAIATFMDADIQDARVVGGIEFHKPDVRGRCYAIIQLDTALELLDGSVKDSSPHHGSVSLRDFMAGMGEEFRKVPIIGEDQEARGVGIQPSHRIQSYGNVLDKLHHGS